jgi:hypothetical protein
MSLSAFVEQVNDALVCQRECERKKEREYVRGSL